MRAEIEPLRALHLEPRARRPLASSSEASLCQRVQTLLDENRRLRSEVGALREELALAYGQLRRRAPRA